MCGQIVAVYSSNENGLRFWKQLIHWKHNLSFIYKKIETWYIHSPYIYIYFIVEVEVQNYFGQKKSRIKINDKFMCICSQLLCALMHELSMCQAFFPQTWKYVYGWSFTIFNISHNRWYGKFLLNMYVDCLYTYYTPSTNASQVN